MIWEKSLAIFLICQAISGCDYQTAADEVASDKVERQPASQVATPLPSQPHKSGELAIEPDEIERVSPEDVYERVQNAGALLVCAYESDIGFWAFELEGAISLEQFREMLIQLPKDQEVFFYCA